ncbi:Dihydroorotate dehydrogenase (quinone), mitochondrial [Sporothrix eucalyptigena]|uniref:Dihydroorotate dehydrogenase (Quinone), mitochondrial n=1 Tax=Sporothrix eucalyptigena TaxID=1812306 RepID=A0ABP0C336_9PEZI
MGSTSPKITAQVADHKAKRRADKKTPSPSPSIKPPSVGVRSPLGYEKRLRAVLAKRVAQVASATCSITRRVTRSMARQQAREKALLEKLAAGLASSPSSNNSKVALIIKPPSPTRKTPTMVTNSPWQIEQTQTSPIAPLPEDDVDSPVYLPRDLREIVPDMARYGRHNCGQHGGSKAKAKILVTCRDCRKKYPVAVLHALPCGHVLCRDCLKEVVWDIDARLNRGPTWDAIQNAMDDEFYDKFFLPVEGQPLVQGNGMDRALELAGMTCCDRLMGLDRHMACLDEHSAAAYWLAHEVLRHPLDLARHRCGWPDCGKTLAPTCYFARKGSQMFYCVRCQGNSIFVREGYLAPSRACDKNGM